jgi:hypothetical protein
VETPEQLLAALRARGVRLWAHFDADGVHLRHSVPGTPADHEDIADHAEALLDLLVTEARREVARRDDDAAAAGRAVEWGEGLRQFWED